LKVTPERSSTIKIINVHGESKRALGEISNFPFNVGGVEIPVDVVVTDVNSYQALNDNDQLPNFVENNSISSLNEVTTHVEDQLSNSMENQIISLLNKTVIHIENQLTSSMDSQTTSSKELLIDKDQIEYSFDLLENQLDQTIGENKEPPECLYNSVENYLSMYFDEIENYEAHNVQLENISAIISGSYNSSLKGEEYLRTNHEGITNKGSIILLTNPNTFSLRLDQQKKNYNDNYQGSYAIGHQVPIYQYFYNELINDKLDEFWIKACLNRIFNAGIQTFEEWIFKENIYNNEIILLGSSGQLFGLPETVPLTKSRVILDHMSLYQSDLACEKPTNIVEDFYIPGDNWDDQLAHICGILSSMNQRTLSNGKTLENYYKLGSLLELKGWNLLAKKKLRTYFSIKKRSIWRIA
ncbi:4393_t:CDS:2, partial [Acaulospora morrowiae]